MINTFSLVQVTDINIQASILYPGKCTPPLVHITWFEAIWKELNAGQNLQ